MSKSVTDSIAAQIEKSKKEITVLFTDIEGSTSFWDEHGDTVGRLMVDRHNKLLFPVIRKHGGKVLKTIGDSIMASFRSPNKAVRAAVAMQQVLKHGVDGKRELDIEIRIGMHTGQAIVEQNDVFGDVVNVAARIEGAAKGGEILVSSATARRLARKRRQFKLQRRHTFIPKGKKTPLTVFSCDWRNHPNLVSGIRPSRLLPMGFGQKLQVATYLVVAFALVYVLYDRFVRYLLADFEFVAVHLLNPSPLASVLLLTGLLALAIFFLLRARSVPMRLLKISKGSFGFGLVFLAVFFLNGWIKPDLGRWWDRVLYRSDHLFVEVLADGVSLHPSPSLKSEPIERVDSGHLFLQTEKIRKGRTTWTKVLVKRDRHRYGYLPRRLPPEVGVPARQITISRVFYFRSCDLISLALGLGGFLWGFLTFRIRPI